MVTENEIVSKVKAIMNEIGEDTNSSLLDEDTIKIDEYIKSCIGDALSLIILNSGIKSINPKKDTGTKANKNDDGSGYIILPDDFVKLLAFKMNGWKRAVSVAYPLDSEEAKRQANIYTRGGENKPICLLSYSPEGEKILEYYSLGSEADHTISLFVYEAAYDSESGINVSSSDPIFYALCYMAASLVYSIFENPNTAKEMQTIAINYINNAIPH